MRVPDAFTRWLYLRKQRESLIVELVENRLMQIIF